MTRPNLVMVTRVRHHPVTAQPYTYTGQRTRARHKFRPVIDVKAS